MSFFNAADSVDSRLLMVDTGVATNLTVTSLVFHRSTSGPEEADELTFCPRLRKLLPVLLAGRALPR